MKKKSSRVIFSRLCWRQDNGLFYVKNAYKLLECYRRCQKRKKKRNKLEHNSEHHKKYYEYRVHTYTHVFKAKIFHLKYLIQMQFVSAKKTNGKITVKRESSWKIILYLKSAWPFFVWFIYLCRFLPLIFYYFVLFQIFVFLFHFTQSTISTPYISTG